MRLEIISRSLMLFLFVSAIAFTGTSTAQENKIPEKTPDSVDTAISDGYKEIKSRQAEIKSAKSENENTSESDESVDQSSDVDESVNSEQSDDLPAVLSDVVRKPLYQSRGKRDPFKPFIKAPKEKEVIITKATPPIKRFPLDEFRIVGIVWVDNQPKAMVVDPEQNTYFLGVDDEIGNKDGVILEVRENGLLVREKRYFEDVFGQQKVEVKKSVLAFAEEEE